MHLEYLKNKVRVCMEESMSSLVQCLTGLLVADELWLGEEHGASLASVSEAAAGHLLRLLSLIESQVYSDHTWGLRPQLQVTGE